MKDFYTNTRAVLDEYNTVQNKIANSAEETTEADDELLQNFCLHLAHALIKDTGYGSTSREELGKVADIINTVIM